MEFDAEQIGRRIRLLRQSRGIDVEDVGTSRAYLSRIETGLKTPFITTLFKICERLDVGMARFFANDQCFDDCLTLENKLVAEVRPYLKSLNAEQKALILKTLEAAPKQRFVRTRKRT